ncbi:MAG: glyceraldehyde 3-phosphate dehydrogenase NAD-binding domain-containing protein [Candidatus Aenigmatarchaeota archaeon]|nr:hypothetical protein [Candidatus Aenigmarchaeota archaeon]
MSDCKKENNNKKLFINGAGGRIGRMVTYEITRILDEEWIGGINDPIGIDRLVESLYEKDFVHGKYDWQIDKIDNHTIKINEHKIPVFSEKDVLKIPLKDLDIYCVEECSGFYGDPKGVKSPAKEQCLARPFIGNGAKRVILSYPADSADITLIAGVNLDEYDPEKHYIISNASCTTKALASPLQLLMDCGIHIRALLMDTVHAATNSQRILESLNQIWTHTTGAAKATGLVIKSLKGKMDGLSYRVPTVDGSFANIYFIGEFDGELDESKINNMFLEHYKDERYMGRIGIIDKKDVGTLNDVVGRRENGIVILSKTRVFPLPYVGERGKSYFVQIVSAYDNEAAPPVDQVIVTKYIANLD